MGDAARELGDWLLTAAARWPDSEALVAGAERWSYRRLAEAVNAQASALRTAGLGPGDRLGIAASRHPQTVIHILAAVRAGVGYVPLDLGYPDERLSMMVEDSTPRAVVGDGAALAELGARLGPLPTIEAPAAPSARYGAEPDLCYVLFTSGSTGRPKGVAMGHEPLARLIDWHASHPRLGRAARTLLFAPLSFDVHFQEIFSTLACGGCLVLTDESSRRDPAKLVDVLCAERIERMFLPYVALQMIADALHDAALPPLRDVVSAGEQLQVSAAIRALFARLPDAVLHNHYGPTESHVVTAFELTGDPARWPDIPPIGAALPYVDAILRALEDGGSDEGELLLGGPTLAHGYLGRPELSAERFLETDTGRVYATGDRVLRGADGVLRYLGRCDRQLKIDGFRIEPGEIEVALLAVPGVRDAAVGAAELPGLGRQLVAWLVAASGAENIETRSRAALRESLPTYLQPARYLLLDRLPLTPSGKIDRAALRVPETASNAAPAGSPAERIAALWRDLLGRPDLGERDNLFDAGARSLLVLRFVAQARAAGITGIGVTDVYDAPSIAGLAERLQTRPQTAPLRRTAGRESGPIAIVGIALRCAGAANVDTFWRNLVDGVEGIRHFRADEVDASVPDSLRQHPAFVAARGVIDEADRFDAGFFGIPAREALLIDPQQRLLLELAWNALEDAGLRPDGEDRIGVYAGSANNTYIAALRREAPQLIGAGGEFAAMLASEKDYVATRIAHKLDLKGPALSIHTACSTGLVAIAQACEALRGGQCEVALAGGATVIVPQAGGYVHVEGGMESADGHCRPFDAEATGTVFASGAAMVALKPLARAIADGDGIYAVIHGVGLNNDGAQKASFTAPNVAGQAAAIRQALDDAGLAARAIGYVEAHGTATTLGDPIEVAALTRAHEADCGAPGSCLLGSVKGHLGHTIAAAGALGLIKCALSLQRGCVPGTLHYRQPNPQIDFAATPFRVSAGVEDWPRSETPRYAAVSSFGVGGTNAHLILGEAPLTASRQADGSDAVLLPLSARTPEAALSRARQLADWLESSPGVALAAVQNTLVVGRLPMPRRLAIAASDRLQAIARLREVARCDEALQQPRLVFLLPGQGSQSAGMAAPLHAALPAYAEALDASLDAVAPYLDTDLGEMLLRREDTEANTLLQQTRYAQPALFCHGYALARWLDTLGLHPAALIGHSLGELLGACLAGVLDLPAAARVICARGAAMWSQPRGAMLAVRQSAEALAARLPSGIEIAGYNAPELTVLSGPAAAIDRLAGELGEAQVKHTRLHVSHGFHSAAMDGALPAVRAAFSEQTVSAPRLPLYSCVSGQALSAAEASDPDYWARQVRAPVRFADAVAAELKQPDTLFVEVGPGQALSALVRMQRTALGGVPPVVALQAPAGQPASAVDALSAVGKLWALGCKVDWPVPRGATRAHLPGYPFADTRFWFPRAATSVQADPASPSLNQPVSAPALAQETTVADRRPVIEAELTRLLAEVCGLPEAEIARDTSLLELGLDSLSLTQASLELDRVFAIKLRFRRLMEDLDTVAKLAAHFDAELPAERFQPAPGATPSATASVAMALPGSFAPTLAPLPATTGDALAQLIQQQMALMQQQLALMAGQPQIGTSAAARPGPTPSPAPAPGAAAAEGSASAPATSQADTPVDLRDKPFGASARIKITRDESTSAAQQDWIDDFTRRYLAKLGSSRKVAQQHRALMADPRVVTGFNPQWKDLVFPIVADRSDGARIWDIDGNEYIDLLSCFGANLLGYQPKSVVAAMHAQLDRGIEVGPSHPLAASVSQLISEFTGHPRVAFCNTGSEAVMGAMRVARTVTGRKTIAIFTNSYHGIFDEVIVRGTRQLRSLSAAPGILASAVENVLVLDYADEASLKVLRERGHELAAIMIEPIQNKYPTLQPRDFVHALREICDAHGCALIFDEVVTGFRLAPGGAQQFYGVRADICTYGKIIGGGLPLAAIGGGAHWLDALDGGFWQFGDDSYPEAGVTYFAGTFVRHPLALAAAQATLEHLKAGGQAYYDRLNGRTQSLIDRLNAGFAARSAPCKAVHCASLWRLQWDEDQRFVSLFYYLARFHGLHLFEQFGHFVTEAMGEAELARIVEVFFACLDELMALGLITRRDGLPPPEGGQRDQREESEAPLSPGQEERWLAAGFDEHALRALNETFVLRLDGALNLDALQRALRALRRRHAAFDLLLDPESPKQRLGKPGAIEPLPLQDLSFEADPEAALQAFAERAGQRGFALGEPMIAPSLLRIGPQSHALHVVASHLVFDGWAASVLISELAVLYRAELDGMPAKLPLPGSPLAFALQERARMDGSEGEQSMAFWRDALRDPPPPPELGDRAPSGPRRFAADTLRCDFDRDLLDALRKQARATKSTLFQLLLAVVAQRLRAEGCGDDLVLSLPYASQQLGRHPALLADGVLDLPLRLRLSGDQDPLRALPSIRRALVDALEHPLMTQGRLARALGLPSRGERPALTGVYFNLNPRVKLDGFAPLSASMREGRKPGLLGELMFNFYEEEDGLALDLHHSTEFFSPQRIAALALALRGDLQRAAGIAPTASVELPEVIRAANATGKPLPAAPRIEHWLAERATQCAQSIAVIDAEREWTYAELFERAHRIAHCLRQRGVKPGDFVGLCLPRSGELLAALLGVLEAGAGYVPLDPYFPLQRLRDMVEDAGLVLLLADRENAARLAVDALPTLLLDGDAAAIEAAPPTPLGLGFEADAPAYVIYTSGSTGKPKGVVVLQRGVCNFLRSMADAPGLAARDTLLAVTTLSFDIAVLELLLPLYVGGRVVIARREDAVDGAVLRGLIERHAVSVMQATPGTWHLLLESGFRPPAGFRALCGGEALSPALAERLLGAGVAELWNMYGPTETTIWSTVARIQDPDAISVGRPIDNTVVRILDEQGQQRGIGEPGELCIGGAGVARGYHARTELTAERFIADAFGGPGERLYRTGDLAAWNADGTLHHMGRLDHQVKLRGYRIELGEIEAALERLPEIARAAVLVQNFGPLDDRLVAFVAAQPGHAIPRLAALRRALGERLPDYMLPQQICELPALPQLPNGKIDRKALVTAPIDAPTPADATPPSLSAPPAATGDDLSASIAAEMARLLQHESVDPTQNFFELGGHSLLAAQLASAVQRLCGRRPSLRQIFEAPSAAGLAVALRAGAPTDETVLPPLMARSERGRAPLSLMQRRLWFVEQTTPDPGVNLLPSAHRLLGAMDVDALRRALRAFVSRHSALRTVFAPSAEGAEQRILADIDVDCPLIDLSGEAREAAEARITEAVSAAQQQAFDLRRGPPFRCALFKLDAEEHVFLWVVHHLVWDGWCFDLLYRDLGALYAAELSGQPVELPAIERDYGDFCAWQRALLDGGQLNHEVAAWKRRLADLPAPLALPLDHQRPAIWSGRGGSEVLRLDSATTARLHAFAQQRGSTLYVLLLAAYAQLLQQLSGQHDLLIGTPLRGREFPELLPVVGFFVNALPLRLRVDEAGFASWMDRVRQAVQDAFAQPNLPLEQLVQSLGILRDPSRPALFQTLFSYQDVRERPAAWGPLQHRRVEVPIAGSAYEIGLWCVETRSGMELVFTYASDLFEPATVRGWAQRYAAMIKGLAEHGSDIASALGTPLAGQADAGEAHANGTPSALDADGYEGLLLDLWRELLGTPDVRAEDNFFELGGHSLLALSMVGRVELACGKRLSLLRVGDSSLRALARELDQQGREAELETIAAGPADAAPPARPGWLGRLLGRG